MKVYTKTGDKGLTGLLGGTRVSKADARIHLYGELDELNSCVGVIRSTISNDHNQQSQLKEIQCKLFDLGSHMACEPDSRQKFKLPTIDLKHVEALEVAIDGMDKDLPALKNFILPTGVLSSSYAHVARTVCRRVERQLVAFLKMHPEDLPEVVLLFLNRLSDYLFVLARSLNHEAGRAEELWNQH